MHTAIPEAALLQRLLAVPPSMMGPAASRATCWSPTQAFSSSCGWRPDVGSGRCRTSELVHPKDRLDADLARRCLLNGADQRLKIQLPVPGRQPGGPVGRHHGRRRAVPVPGRHGHQRRRRQNRAGRSSPPGGQPRVRHGQAAQQDVPPSCSAPPARHTILTAERADHGARRRPVPHRGRGEGSARRPHVAADYRVPQDNCRAQVVARVGPGWSRSQASRPQQGRRRRDRSQAPRPPRPPSRRADDPRPVRARRIAGTPTGSSSGRSPRDRTPT